MCALMVCACFVPTGANPDLGGGGFGSGMVTFDSSTAGAHPTDGYLLGASLAGTATVCMGASVKTCGFGEVGRRSVTLAIPFPVTAGQVIAVGSNMHASNVAVGDPEAGSAPPPACCGPRRAA
jgi:hypothetical protein